MSIRLKVLISMFASFLVVVICLSSFMYGRFERIIVSQIKNDIKASMLENKQSFDSIAKGMGRSFAAISSNEFMIKSLNKVPDSSTEASNNKTNFINEYRSFFELSVGSMLNEYMLHFYVNDECAMAKELGKVKSNTFENTEFGMYSLNHIKNENWYNEVYFNDGPFYTFRLEENPEYIYFAKAIKAQIPVYTNYDSMMGVGIIGIDCLELLQKMQILSLSDNMMVAVLDSNNQIIAKNENGLDNNYVKKIADENLIGFNVAHTFEDDEYVINMVRTDIGVSFVSFVPLDSIYLKASDIRTVVIGAIFVAIIATFLILIILSYYLTRPIKRLADSMGKIDYSNLNAIRVKSDNRDEVGELYRSFNIMLDKIVTAKQRENEQNKKTQQMEIQMLQAQINPHFLYNVLDSISWLAIEKGEDEIGEMADLLSQILSYSIKDGKITAKFSEELECVRKYVMLQRNRYAGNIDLNIDVPDDVCNIEVPKCILQPLVENSIIHGMSESEGISIKISVERKGKYIQISIEDDGKGSEVDALNKILSGENRQKYHVGIRNVAMRIKHTYNEGCGLEYEKNEKGGISAKILLDTNVKI
ncbi:MAG: HAMP domain-containing protein [Ruminococcaceae bacterium]|nr:HAMP domain-containing protein [Oscillospiraceae bacterium]